jgi:hypothetical protein
MAKKSSIEKNKRRERLALQFAAKRGRLKAIANDESVTMEERFEARLKLAALPRIQLQPVFVVVVKYRGALVVFTRS